MREPDFENLLRILDRQKPSRPTLFEYFLNVGLYKKLAGAEVAARHPGDQIQIFSELEIHGFKNAGYDYVNGLGSDLEFAVPEADIKKTISLNAGDTITDRKSFEDYPWPDPDKSEYCRLDRLADAMCEGMKAIVGGPFGLLENVIRLTGFDNLCFMLVDEPDLAKDIFDAVGSRLLRYYEICAPVDVVGACIVNDDWGFKTQTMISPEDMRKYVFPWHKKTVETIHAAGKPAILHSCGNPEQIMDDIIDDMKYDGKHSYEDNIIPVEEAYDRWGHRIAILGGIDLDFICKKTPEQITHRCREMLRKTESRGGYALGSGNSIPEYVPHENYFAMISTVVGCLD